MNKYWPLMASAAFFLITGCGGGGGGSPEGAARGAAVPLGSAIAAAAENVLPITVNRGPAGFLNLAYATVTICEPNNSSNCQAIDHVLVDTASNGLRVMSSALSPSLSLPHQVDANGNPVAQCAQFASGFTWGPVKLADVEIAGKRASSLAIQVIGDPGFSAIPGNCTGTGAPGNSVESFAVNGILGVGVFRQDCGFACEFNANSGIYYACSSSGCQAAAMPRAKQLHNPVSLFAADNNGVMVQLPSIADAGQAGVSGALVFGIGTQANNSLGSASVLTLNPSTGQLTTIYNGRTITNSIIDSGSNAVFFSDSSIPACSGVATRGFFCPASTQTLSATLEGMNGTSANVEFSVANADTLIGHNPHGPTAFPNLGGPTFAFLGFDWGLPFFYGRKVFVALEGANTPGGPGPYAAF